MTLLNQWIKPLTAALGLLALAGCAQLPHNSVVEKPQEIVFVTPPAPVANGSLFQGGVGYIPLFEDRRPRNIGDTLTIVLDEQVSASKSSGSNATRSGSTGFKPGLLPEQLAVLQDLGLEVSGNNDFAGGGGSNANNSFTGTITVTVIGLLPNGNLNVRGEKHIGINQGKEYIRFSGMVNPRTISAQNSVPSTQVAEARIEYVGDGYINEAQHMGWLQRFFLNIAPF